MTNPLDVLLADGVIDDVVRRLRGGKEADVYLVQRGAEMVAAKVYKDRAQRSFKNNSAYKEGRLVHNSRTQRAIDKGSRFGQREAEDAWKSAESSALYRLHAMGVRVPTPVMFYEGVLLMQLVTDAQGLPAPRLVDATIALEDASAMYLDIRKQLIGMLCCELIHGDLSPYNVLLGSAGPTIIDFPQIISVSQNSQSESFFRRDFENIHRFFVGIDRQLNAMADDGREIWRTYVRRELSPDFVPRARSREEYRPAQRPPAGRPGFSQGPRNDSRQGQAPPRGAPPGHSRAQQGPRHDARRGSAGPQTAHTPQQPNREAPRAKPGPVVEYVNRTGPRMAAPAEMPIGQAGSSPQPPAIGEESSPRPRRRRRRRR